MKIKSFLLHQFRTVVLFGMIISGFGLTLEAQMKDGVREALDRKFYTDHYQDISTPFEGTWVTNDSGEIWQYVFYGNTYVLTIDGIGNQRGIFTFTDKTIIFVIKEGYFPEYLSFMPLKEDAQEPMEVGYLFKDKKTFIFGGEIVFYKQQ
jgi:hypothetical protein